MKNKPEKEVELIDSILRLESYGIITKEEAHDCIRRVIWNDNSSIHYDTIQKLKKQGLSCSIRNTENYGDD